MPLIDLKTNLKDLKFGHDRLNGGSSKQPYIETPITTDLEGNNPWNKDFILRGGIDTVENSLIDVKRLGKFFLDLDSPSGLLFVLKQNLLSRIAVKPQSKYNRILNEGIYTPISTLAQVAGSAFGLHANKQGLNPFQGIGQVYTPDRYMEALYDEIELAKRDTVPTRNRLYGLYNYKIENLKSPLVTGNLKYTNISEDSNLILTYPGGPESILGIGKTNIKFADQRTGENNPYLKNSGFFTKNDQTKSYNFNAFKGKGNFIQTLQNTIIPLGVTYKFRDKFGKNADNLEINLNVFDSSNITAYTPFNPTNIQLGPVNDRYYSLVGYDNYIPDGYKYIDFKDSTNNAKFQTANPHSVEDSLLVSPLGASNYYGLTTDIDIYNSSYGSNVKHWTFRSNNTYTPVIDVNGVKLLGASTKYFTPLTPQQNGFTPSGSVNGNVRSVGQLNNPDKTLSTSNVNNLAGANNAFTYTQEELTNIPTSPNTTTGESFLIGKFNSTSEVGDFRKLLRSKADKSPLQYQPQLVLGLVPDSPNYTKKNIETRVGLGNPGDTKFKNLISYTNGKPGALLGAASETSYDKINAGRIYSNQITDDPDLVLFKIGIIDNDTPSNTTYIQFRAFLDQISDTYNADWQATKYIGRGENFYTYGGFDRKVSLSWTVAAQSKIELIPMYKKLNYLASICAPDYSSAGYMRGNIVTLTVGGYFYEQPGIINGFNYEMNNDNASWEIGISDDDDASVDESVRQLPHLIKVNSFNFIPIHTFVPRKQQLNIGKNGYVTDNGYGPERYIALKDVTGDKETYGTIYTNPNTATSNAPQTTTPQPNDSNPTSAYSTTSTNTFSRNF